MTDPKPSKAARFCRVAAPYVVVTPAIGFDIMAAMGVRRPTHRKGRIHRKLCRRALDLAWWRLLGGAGVPLPAGYQIEIRERVR